MTFVQVLHFQGVCIALQLLLLLMLLPLPQIRSTPCPSTVEEIIVANTSDAKTLAKALLCDGPANFTVSWHGNIMISYTVSVSNGSTLNVTGSGITEDAVVTSDGTFLLFEVDRGSTVSLTDLTLSGGDGGLRVTGDSFAEVIDCTFTNNNITSFDQGGEPTELLSLYLLQRTRDRLQHIIYEVVFAKIGSTTFLIRWNLSLAL